jgi:hypothetical protein
MNTMRVDFIYSCHVKRRLSIQLYVCSFLELYYSENTLIIEFVEDPWLLVRVSDFRVNLLAFANCKAAFYKSRGTKGWGKRVSNWTTT